MGDSQARHRFGAARVARLATADANGQPHLVPVTFALNADVIAVAIDHKPKTTLNLKRLHNIAVNPRVSFLVDEYSEAWEHLWWVRADGRAEIAETGWQREKALRWLHEKYRQYRGRLPTGPVIVTQVETWTGWQYSEY